MQRGMFHHGPATGRRRTGTRTAGIGLVIAGLSLGIAPGVFAADDPGTQTAPATEPETGALPADALPVQQAIAAKTAALVENHSSDNDNAGQHSRDRDAAGRRQAVVAFYADRNDRPAWYDDQGQPTAAAHALRQAMSQTDRQGLSPQRYLTGVLAQPLDPVEDPAARAEDDLAISQGFVALAHDLHYGAVDDPSVHVRWRQPRQNVDYAKTLAQAAQGNPQDVLQALAPQQPAYQALQQGLAQYRKIARDGGWPTVADGPVLKKGMNDPRIATLWHRLQITGDADAGQSVPGQYDAQVMSALRHYQARNGLKQDGLLGPSTRDALNVPVAQRLAEIELNMERWRWMPASFGDRYIAVNVPAFSLDAVDADGSDLSMDVIVGGSYHDKATPIFGDTMQYLVFRPYWNVPPSIAADEIVPEQRKNPHYLASKHYQIVRTFGPDAKPLAVNSAHIDAVARGDLLIRQAGGPDNALGLVKFIFPNDHAVYLHSTSAKQLFDRNDRDLSHGCVRVADPVALAAFALEGKPDWTRQKIDAAMHTGGRKKVNLAQSIPVYMLYWTAFVADDAMNFRADLYDHDNELDAALKTASEQRT